MHVIAHQTEPMKQAFVLIERRRQQAQVAQVVARKGEQAPAIVAATDDVIGLVGAETLLAGLPGHAPCIEIRTGCVATGGNGPFEAACDTA